MSNTTPQWSFDPGRMARALADARPLLDKHVLELAETTTELAKDKCKKVTGTNARSITADYTKGDGSKLVHLGKMGQAGSKEGFKLSESDVGVRIYTQSGYGGYLEMGTMYMAAQPYIRPSFERAVSGLKRGLDGAL